METLCHPFSQDHVLRTEQKSISFNFEMLSFIVLFQVSCIMKQPGKKMRPLLNCTYSTRLRSCFYLLISTNFLWLQPWPEVPAGEVLRVFLTTLRTWLLRSCWDPDASVLGKGERGQQPDVHHKKKCDKMLGIHSGNLDITNFWNTFVMGLVRNGTGGSKIPH